VITGVMHGAFATRGSVAYLSFEVEGAHRFLQSFLSFCGFLAQSVRRLSVPESFEAHRWGVLAFQQFPVHLHGLRDPPAVRHSSRLAVCDSPEAALFDPQLSAQVDIHVGCDRRLFRVPVQEFHP
jgi:hypothetical protein